MITSLEKRKNISHNICMNSTFRETIVNTAVSFDII